MLSACGGGRLPAEAVMQAHPNDDASIVTVLDDFHDAAARADEPRYFDHFADDGVFLGTDATERWDVNAFRAYAHPHFAKGKAWDMHAVRRHVTVLPAANVASRRLPSSNARRAAPPLTEPRGARMWQKSTL